jgi:hypothetical protein
MNNDEDEKKEEPVAVEAPVMNNDDPLGIPEAIQDSDDEKLGTTTQIAESIADSGAEIMPSAQNDKTE